MKIALKEKEKNVYAGSGISMDDEPYAAGFSAAEMAIEKCGKVPEFGLVFCSGGKYGKNDASIKKLAEGAYSAFSKANPKCIVIGCTTAGEMSNYGFTTNSCVVLAVQSDYIQFGVGIGKNTSAKPVEAGKEAIKKALNSIKIDKYVEPYVRYLAEKNLPVTELVKMKPYTVLMFNTGFTASKRGNEDDIVEGIVDVIGHRIPIIGGSAGDDFNLKNTYVFVNSEVYKDSVVCAFLSSSIKISNYVAHGYVHTDKSMFINKAKDYIIEELDYKPAFDRYSEVLGMPKEEIWPKTEKLRQLGPISQAFMSFAKKVGVDIMKLSPIIGINCNSPLALVEYKPYIKGRFWIKTVDSLVDGNSLRFTEKVPQGASLYFMKTDKDKSLRAGHDSVTKSLEDIGGEASFGIIIDCALHRWFLSEHAAKSVDMIKQKMGDTPFIGFHAYGEILDGKHTLSVVSLLGGKKLITG